MNRVPRNPLDRAVARFVRYAHAHAPAVRKIFDEAGIRPGDIRRVADLERVPVTGKDRLMQLQRDDPPFGGFLAIEPKRVRRVFQSPGPLYEPRGAEKALDRTGAAVFRIAGFRRGDIVLNALSYHLSPGGWILDGGLRYLGATVAPGGAGNAELQVRLLLDLGATGYAGTPSFLLALLKKAEEMGVRDRLMLRRALFTAEPYPPSLRAQFETGYGLQTTNAYATAELGFLAHDCAAQQGLHCVEGAVVQVCDPATGKPVGTGETGQVVVTTFNETYPTIRLGTGDLATFEDAPCACGRTTPRLALVGRLGDAVKVRGMFVHPNQLKAALGKFPEVARGQAIVTRQEARDMLALRLEAGEEGAEREALTARIGEAVRELCRVGVDEIRYVASGTIAADAKAIVDERRWE